MQTFIPHLPDPSLGGISLTSIIFGRNTLTKVIIKNVWKSSVLGMSGAAMARHGFTLWQNEDAGSGKVFKCLRGLRDII